MSKLAQLGPTLKESLSGAANKLGVNIYQVMGGIILGAGAMTMVSGGRIEIESLTGPYKFTPAASTEETVARSARASVGNLLKPGIAAVCEKSPMLGKTVGILTPRLDDVFSVRAVRYVPCNREQLTQEIILLHSSDMNRIARDSRTDGPKEVRAHIIDKEPVMLLGKDQELAFN